LQGELKRITQMLHEFTNKLDQSRGQIEQLAQRNASIMGEVRRIETALDETPRLNIKEAYLEALDSQQRLLTIRGQMEKLQSQEVAVRQEAQAVQAVIDILSREEEAETGTAGFLDPRETVIRVMDAQEKERERLARQMHDGPAHSLTNFILQAEICQKLFDRGDAERARGELMNLKSAAGEAFQRVRDFIFDLRPMMLTDLGLVPTVRRYLDAYKNKTGIETEFSIMGQERRLPDYLEVMVFRGIQELMVNARDHGEADSVDVTLEMEEDVVRVLVRDNGRGFGTGKLNLDAEGEALGLRALRERVSLVGGNIRIDSVSGQGATIAIELPIGPDPLDPNLRKLDELT
jgi:two-component system sensor histidine kinase DegS